MIKELKGVYEFFQNDPVSKYFFNRKSTENEKKKMNELYNRICEFAWKVDIDIQEFICAGYLDDFGYYRITYADRGWFDLCPLGENINDVANYCIGETLISKSQHYELKNREKLKKDFKSRFGNIGFENRKTDKYILKDYYPKFYSDEYKLSIYDKYYDGNIPSEIIKRYTNSLNNSWWSKAQEIEWEYDYEKKKFNCKRLEKGKTRKKNKN